MNWIWVRKKIAYFCKGKLPIKYHCKLSSCKAIKYDWKLTLQTTTIDAEQILIKAKSSSAHAPFSKFLKSWDAGSINTLYYKGQALININLSMHFQKKIFITYCEYTIVDK